MKGRFFLDTNIFVYSFDTTQPNKQKKAYQLIQEALLSGRGLISYQVLQEFFNLAFKKFAKPISAGDARDYYRKLLMPLCTIHSSHNLLVRAFTIHEETNYGWYDCLIISAALEGGCKTLYTEDLQDGCKIDSLTVINPFGY